MATPDDLGVLFNRIVDRDRDAFRELYESMSPKLFAIAMRIVRDKDKSADALQEAFLQIWQKAESYDGRQGALEAWMTNIVRFRAIDMARRERTRVDYLARESATRLDQQLLEARNNASPETDLTLLDCLGALGQDQRNAILAVHFNGYTGEEFAQRQDVPLGTIKSRIRRGLQGLRVCMEQ